MRKRGLDGVLRRRGRGISETDLLIQLILEDGFGFFMQEDGFFLLFE